MKKLITILLSVSLVSGTITISCNKNPDLQRAKEIQSQTSLKDSPTVPAIINVTCTGTCPNGDGCSFRVVGGTGFGQCDCEGCTLVVEFPDSENGSNISQEDLLKELSTKDLFIEHLDNFVFKKFNTSQYGIERLQFAHLDDDNYYIHYDVVTDRGLVESVLYVCRSDLSDAPKKYEIDCDGTCSDPSETCREQFNFNPPSADCTCAGPECTMIVTEIID